MNQLQQRARWTSRKPNLRPNQIVLIKSKGEKPFQWPLGQIVQVFPDKDGQVRIAEVLFRGRPKMRAVTSLVPLVEEREFANFVK